MANNLSRCSFRAKNLRSEVKSLIGVISDTHIPKRAKGLPPEVIVGLKGVELILHAGDILVQSVLEDLAQIAPVYAVHGNCDFPEVKDELPAKRMIKYAGFKIGLTHGHNYCQSSGLSLGRVVEAFDEDVDAIVFGHSHRPYNERINGILVFNPGSPTDKRFEAYYSYGLIVPQKKRLIGQVKYYK